MVDLKKGAETPASEASKALGQSRKKTMQEGSAASHSGTDDKVSAGQESVKNTDGENDINGRLPGKTGKKWRKRRRHNPNTKHSEGAKNGNSALNTSAVPGANTVLGESVSAVNASSTSVVGQGETATGASSPNNQNTSENEPVRRRKRRNNRKRRGKSEKQSDQTNNDSKQSSVDEFTQKKSENARVKTKQNNHYLNANRRNNYLRGPVYAALDLGTNNCRLLMATPTRPGEFRVVDAFSRIVRLGEGYSKTGRLSENAMERAIEALKVCALKIEGRKIRKMRLIATQACRVAENGEHFLKCVYDETGLQLEIVDQETEAKLAVTGCSSLVERGTKSSVLFDIGGGSSEIAVLDLSGKRKNRLADHISAWTSLPLGVVTLSEKYGGQNVTREVFEAMVSEVSDMLLDFHTPNMPVNFETTEETFHLLGTSGTVTTLAGVHLGLERYDRRRVDGLWLAETDVIAMTNKLLAWNFEERAKNPCIGEDRADLVLAGCAILEAIRRRWPAKRLRVADRGLREGLLNEMMSSDIIWKRHKNSGKNSPKSNKQQK